jgi:hypothetical protein
MQVLTDAQWAKFEAAIAAVKLRGARPRKEDRRAAADQSTPDRDSPAG